MDMNGWKSSFPNTSHVANSEKCDAWMCLGARNETSIMVVNVNVVKRPERKSWSWEKNRMESKKNKKAIKKIELITTTI